MIFPLKNKETMRLAKEYNAITVDDPGGISEAVNSGIAEAKRWHEYITWVGDDDFLMPGSLKTTVTALDSNKKAVVAFGYCEYINEDGKHVFTSRAGRFAPWIMRWGPNLVPMPGLLLRKSALDVAGVFNPKNKYAMDLDLLLRLKKQGKFINTRKVLAAFRWHADSQTVSNRDVVIKETEAVKRKYLPRPLQIISPIWHRPVRLATKIAARRVTVIANRAK
jgi:GT2 family glycosyltransferase